MHAWLLLTSVLLVLTLAACGSTVTPITEEPDACIRDGSVYVCNGLNDHQITIQDVPDDVTADLLEISPQREQELLNADTEGTGCVFMIAGDLVFYREGELLTEFASPITITYYFMQQDLDAYSQCQETLQEKGLVQSADEVEFVPIYFDKNTELWTTFAKDDIVVINQDSGEMTIQVMFWGDQPIGGGTQP
jgi:hypothetical protein